MTFPNPDTQFKPGQSGNPAGRPPGKNRSTILREVADLVIAGAGLDGSTVNATAEEFAMVALVRKAILGDVPAIKELNDTLYGKVADKKEVDLKADVKSTDLTAKALQTMTKEQLETLLASQSTNNSE